MTITPLPDTQVQSESLEQMAYRIVEEMGLGLTFRSCTCGQLPCARLRPLRDALEAVRRNERERAAKVAEESGTVFYAERQKKHSPYNPKTLIFAQDVCDKIAKAIREGR